MKGDLGLIYFLEVVGGWSGDLPFTDFLESLDRGGIGVLWITKETAKSLRQISRQS